MSFKKFSASQTARSDDKARNEAKTAPTDATSASQSVKQLDEAAPAHKS